MADLNRSEKLTIRLRDHERELVQQASEKQRERESTWARDVLVRTARNVVQSDG